MVALREQMHMGSDCWTKKQQRAPCMQAASAARERRLMVTARGEIDLKFITNLRRAMSTPALYSLIPVNCLTEEMNCTAFRVATRIGGEWGAPPGTAASPTSVSPDPRSPGAPRGA